MSSLKSCKGAFKVIWSLENFSYATQKEGESLSSPTFVIETPMRTRWHLKLYPRGKTDSLFISCYFKREEYDDCSYNIFVTSQFSVLDKYGKQHNFHQIDNHAVGRQNTVGVSNLINRDYLFQSKDVFLPKDTLKICFCACDIVLTQSVQCEIYSLFGVEKRSFLWTVDNFKKHKRNGQWQIDIPSASDSRSSLKMIFVSKGESDHHNTAQIGIKCKSASPIYLVCNISSINKQGKTQVLAFDKHFFCNNDFWVLFQFGEFSELFVSENLFQNDGDLILRCVVTVCDGLKMNHIVSSICDDYFPENESKV